MAKESLGRRFRKSVYEVVAGVDQKLNEKGGLVGKVADAVTGFVGDAVKTGQKMNEDIQKSGGYAAAAKRTGKTIAGSVNKHVFERTRRLYRSIENDLFTDGKLDSEKVKAIVTNKTNAVKKYGEKAYNGLSKLASQGTEALKKDYHDFIPTEEDLKGKYSGIGIKYRGVLLTEDYEKCLDFRKKVQRKLPKKTKFRAQILEDIKTSASDSKEDLVKFYAWQVTQEDDGKSAPDKIKTLNKYLKNVCSEEVSVRVSVHYKP